MMAKFFKTPPSVVHAPLWPAHCEPAMRPAAKREGRET